MPTNFYRCADCGAPAGAECDETCPSAQAAEHDQVLAEIDAWNDFAATTYPDERRWVA